MRDRWLKPESAESAGFCRIVSHCLITPCSTLQVGGGFKRSAHSADPERCIQLRRPSTARHVVHGKTTSMEFRWVEITIMGVPRADPYPCSWSGTPIGRRSVETCHDASRCVRSRQDASAGSPAHGQRKDVVDPVAYDPTQEAHGRSGVDNCDELSIR